MVKKAATSTTCDLQSCSRTVRYDNPTFPFCSYHSGLKRDSSPMSDLATSPSAMSVIRDTLYNPRRSLIPRAAMAVGMIAAGSKLSSTTAAKVYRAWYRASEGVDHNDPDQALSARDRILTALAEGFSGDGYTARRAACSGGMVRLPGTGYRTTADHEVLVIERDSERLIADGATAAPLTGVTDNVSTLFRSGESTAADGLFIAQPFEYGAFSSITYEKISVDGETIWSTPKITEDSDVEAQRRLADKFPPVFPPVNYQVSRLFEDEEEPRADDRRDEERPRTRRPAEQRSSGEPTLEELLERR